MRKIDKLQETAQRYAADIHTNQADILDYGREMFIRGAKWYAQTIWHKPNERPTMYFINDRVSLLLLRGNLQSTAVTFTHDEISDLFSFRDFRKYDNTILAWAYITELQP